MFAEKSVIFNFCEILFQIKDDLYKKFDDGDGVINRVFYYEQGDTQNTMRLAIWALEF